MNPWLDQTTTAFNACSLETLPLQCDHPDAKLPLVIGCYQLNESTDGDDPEASSTRSGELRLYTIHNGDKLHFDQTQVVNMESGVLDGKWRCRSVDSSPLFASACASGRIHLHSLDCDSENRSWRLNHTASSTSEDAAHKALCLSLAWDECSKSENASNRIVSSYSDGTVALHNVSYSKDQTDISETERWDAHSMFGCPSEVWTCSFLRGNENVIMSGADDCTLKIWDVRQTENPTHKIDKEFEAGVTSISSHPSIDHMFAVGSYDEYVRLYDCRMLKDSFWKVHVGGGVWRIKWHPKCGTDLHGSRILVAAMHGGCRVIGCHDGCAEVSSSFTEHKSMAYGADWIWFDGQQNNCEAAASCSFYDRQAFLWNPQDFRVNNTNSTE